MQLRWSPYTDIQLNLFNRNYRAKTGGETIDLGNAVVLNGYGKAQREFVDTAKRYGENNYLISEELVESDKRSLWLIHGYEQVISVY